MSVSEEWNEVRARCLCAHYLGSRNFNVSCRLGTLTECSSCTLYLLYITVVVFVTISPLNVPLRFDLLATLAPRDSPKIHY